MAAEVYVISGFLGAGKTTLIQKLLKEAFHKDKIVLIENDFGEISVDAAILKSTGIEVREINSGCICCSLSGDFIKAIKEILERFQPDKIIIEPSGVGKLSDIIKACADPRVAQYVNVKAKITVADVKRCKMYLDNFGEFFEDQIENADVIMLSRTENYPDKIKQARDLIVSLNDKAAVLAKPWDQLSADDILSPRHDTGENGHSTGCQHKGCCHHDAHDHKGHEACGNDHAADEVFDTITIRTSRKYSIEDIKDCINKLEHGVSGTVLRAKGIVSGVSGYMNLQYIPGDLKISSSTAGGDVLSIIGKDLNRNELIRLFSGE